jgi:uncharacterized cupin superfamily protein
VLTAGVWKCTAHTLKFGRYPVDEFMLVLDGSVNVILDDPETPISEEPASSSEAPVSARAIRLSPTEGLEQLELSNPENFEGGMTLSEDGGAEHSFSAPDVLLELPDTINAWSSSKNVRKYYCIFEP